MAARSEGSGGRPREPAPTVLFVCLHGAAKSVIAAARDRAVDRVTRLLDGLTAHG